MELIVVTGLSGAGKSQAITVLEDLDVYCVENIPAPLFADFFKICSDESYPHERVAVVIDSRNKSDIEAFAEIFTQLKQDKINCKLLFLDCSIDVLTMRYKETRRRHPLLDKQNPSIEQAIRADVQLMAPLREEADVVIDTTLLSSSQLRERIRCLFENGNQDDMIITCLSFGFKFGVPRDVDIVLDVRCLPNPFYIPDLKPHTGTEKMIQDFVMAHEESRELLERFVSMVDFLFPLYKREGKVQLVVAFGCTGGKHRSVTFAEMLNAHMRQIGRNCTVYHRDITR